MRRGNTWDQAWEKEQIGVLKLYTAHRKKQEKS